MALGSEDVSSYAIDICWLEDQRAVRRNEERAIKLEYLKTVCVERAYKILICGAVNAKKTKLFAFYLTSYPSLFQVIVKLLCTRMYFKWVYIKVQLEFTAAINKSDEKQSTE